MLGFRSCGAVVATWLFAASAHAEPPEQRRTRAEVPFFSLGLRLGAVAWGTGVQKDECSGPCATFAPVDTAYSHSPAFALGVEALFGSFDRLRFGIAAMYVPVNDVRLSGTDRTFEVGSDLALDAVAEFVIRATDRVWVLPRVQGGPLVLSPDGDLRTLLDAVNRDYCAGRAAGCDSLTGSYLGWNVGAGAGALYAYEAHVRFRADVFFQYYTVPLYTLSSRLATQPIEVSERLKGGRVFFTLGAEFF